MRRLPPFLLAATGAALVAACGSSDTSSSGAASGSTCETGTLTASGSTALQPLVQKAAQDYQAKCSGATVTVSGGGSSAGLSNVASGVSDIGDSDVPSSFVKNIDASALKDHQVAVAVFAVIVNPGSGVTALTAQQVQDVFSGKVTNWKDVGGGDVPITLIERKPGSGTRLTFDKTVMKGTAESSSPASTQDSTQLVLQGVVQAPGGVSYVGVASASSSVTKVTIDGAGPTAADVQAGKYPFYAHEHMYTKGDGSALAKSFIAFIMAADFQQEVVQIGFLTASTTTQPSAVDIGGA